MDEGVEVLVVGGAGGGSAVQACRGARVGVLAICTCQAGRGCNEWGRVRILGALGARGGEAAARKGSGGAVGAGGGCTAGEFASGAGQAQCGCVGKVGIGSALALRAGKGVGGRGNGAWGTGRADALGVGGAVGGDVVASGAGGACAAAHVDFVRALAGAVLVGRACGGALGADGATGCIGKGS